MNMAVFFQLENAYTAHSLLFSDDSSVQYFSTVYTRFELLSYSW